VRFTEKILPCYNCKRHFIFTVEAQELRSSQGYPNDPTNCPTCRRARNTRISNHTSENADHNSPQQTYPITCTQCGKAARVSFNPRPGKPMYCSVCQMKIRVGR
jgi:CxxC-x17-CxxC domain-containing protein